MTTATLEPDAVETVAGRGGGGPAPTRTVVAYGFWIFLLSDFVLFSALFASYAVLSDQTAGGLAGPQLFNLRSAFIETICLLLSSYSAGLGALAAERRQLGGFYLSALFTILLGAAFLAIELSEFAGMISRGATPSRSAFLSAFFTLVGTHGAHVATGLFWFIYMLAQVAVKGLRPNVLRRLLCFSLFWHALDIVWIGVLTLVYLIGAR
jgi:cytochrome o ubiquinol oxidase subunit III